MNGWTLADVRALDRDERSVIIEEMNKLAPDDSPDTEVMQG
jgi:hypothetical protein